MLKKIYILLIMQAILSVACASDNPKVQLKPLEPESQHQLVFQTTTQLIASYHYSKPKIDDEFSSKALDNYINHIDPSHVYFLKSDIEAFEKYRYVLDDAVFSGNVDPGFDIFNVYRQRMQERVEYSLTLLTDSFDFNQNDSFMIDRDKAPWPKDYKEYDQLWNQKVKYECLLLAGSGKAHKSYSETVRKRYENLLKISAKTKSEDVFQLFVNALLELADPHTNYFSPRSAEDFTQSMSLSLEGIGAQLRTDNEYTKVNEIIKGGPADKSKKLHAGDKIIGVAQGKDSDIVNVIDWRIDDVVALIRGKKGTVVKLEIIPASEPNKTRVIELVRDKIVLEEQAAKSSVKEVKRGNKKLKVGVITVPTFYINFADAQRGDPNYKSTTRDVKKLIKELQQQKIDGLIIDLRNNGGGSLQEAVELTGLFIKQGPVVQVKDVNGNVREETDNDPEIFYSGPLVVLVNRFSASASEIFSGAIQDYNRGVVMGERTYGKGTVQNMIDLNNIMHLGGKKVGQVKLTIAKFYRVSGSSTQHKGVIPDVLFPGVYDEDKYGEDASPYALPWDQIKPTDYAQLDPNSLHREELNKHHTQRMLSNLEYKYLEEDIDYLKQLESKKYETLNIKQYKSEVDEQEKVKKEREAQQKKAGIKSGEKYDLILNEGSECIADLMEVRYTLTEK